MGDSHGGRWTFASVSASPLASATGPSATRCRRKVSNPCRAGEPITSSGVIGSGFGWRFGTLHASFDQLDDLRKCHPIILHGTARRVIFGQRFACAQGLRNGGVYPDLGQNGNLIAIAEYVERLQYSLRHL